MVPCRRPLLLLIVIVIVIPCVVSVACGSALPDVSAQLCSESSDRVAESEDRQRGTMATAASTVGVSSGPAQCRVSSIRGSSFLSAGRGQLSLSRAAFRRPVAPSLRVNAAVCSTSFQGFVSLDSGSRC